MVFTGFDGHKEISSTETSTYHPWAVCLSQRPRLEELFSVEGVAFLTCFVAIASALTLAARPAAWRLESARPGGRRRSSWPVVGRRRPGAPRSPALPLVCVR